MARWGTLSSGSRAWGQGESPAVVHGREQVIGALAFDRQMNAASNAS